MISTPPIFFYLPNFYYFQNTWPALIFVSILPCNLRRYRQVASKFYDDYAHINPAISRRWPLVYSSSHSVARRVGKFFGWSPQSVRRLRQKWYSFCAIFNFALDESYTSRLRKIFKCLMSIGIGSEQSARFTQDDEREREREYICAQTEKGKKEKGEREERAREYRRKKEKGSEPERTEQTRKAA